MKNKKPDGGKKKMILGRGLEKVIDIVGEVLAFATIAIILLLYINGKFSIIDLETTNKLAYAREFLIITVIGLKALEFALKRGLILSIICLAIIAAAYIFVFFPGAIPGWTFDNITQAFSNNLTFLKA